MSLMPRLKRLGTTSPLTVIRETMQWIWLRWIYRHLPLNLKLFIALKTMEYWTWKKEYKERLFGGRIIRVYNSEPWTTFLSPEGTEHKYRLVKFRYQHSKLSWWNPSKVTWGTQFNSEEATPLRFSDPEEAIRSFNQVNAMITGYNRNIQRMNKHAVLREEMGINK